MNDPLLYTQKRHSLSRFLQRLSLALLLIACLLAATYSVLRHRQLKPIPVVTDAAVSTDLTAPLLDAAPVILRNHASSWQASWRAPQTAIEATLARRYPGFSKRFPKGLALTIVSQPQAPEPLRGPYDDQPAELTVGAIYPEPQPGEHVSPDFEAWAGCRRDLELGPARQLHCYLYVRGEPGDTLDALAVLAWIQALDETLSGHIQPLDRNNLPFLNAHKEGEQWIYADSSLLSLEPVNTPSSSSSGSS